MSEVAKLSIVTDSGEIDISHIQATNKLSVGEQLLLARTQQNLSIEHIAGQSKWSLRQIAEVEAGRYAVLHDLASLRGFVRTYAKILKLDAAPLLEQLSLEFAKLPVKSVDRPLLDTPFHTGRMPWWGRQNSKSYRALGGLFLLLLCLTAFAYRSEIALLLKKIIPVGADTATEHLNKGAEKFVHMPSESHQGMLTEGVSVHQSMAAYVEPVSTSVSDTAQLPANSKESLSPTTIESSPQKKDNFTSFANTGASTDNTQSKEINKELNVNTGAVSNGDLVLSFNQDSWVQIKRLDNSIVVSRLYKAGSEEVVSVAEPLKIILGNAPGVEAKFRGQNLDLQTSNGSRVINLNIK